VTEVLCPVLVGRAAEVQALKSALGEAVAGRGGCVLITGEAGIGKSRLVRELVRLAVDEGVRVAGGRAVPAAATTAYRPFSEALLQLLRDVALPDDPSLAPWLPHLGAFLPGLTVVGGPAEPPAGTDAIRGEAVLQLFHRLSPDGLVVTLEDLHWADPDTVAVFEYLADNSWGQPMLFVASLRTEPASPAGDLVRRLRGRPGLVHLHLSRLSEEEAAEMIAASSSDADAAARARIARISDGIPLFVEELLASPGIPESIADTVRSRLAELSDDERAVIESAAVMGRRFDWEILPAASGRSRDVVSRALARAVDRVLVSADTDGFRFRHALQREAVLASMLPPRMREAAGEALAAVDSAHPYLEGSWREVAADLALRASDRTRAGRLLADSGCDSLNVGALATSVDTLRRAVELLEEPERADAELALLQALALAGRVDEAADAGSRLVRRLAEAPATRETRIEAHLRVAHAAVAASRWPLARRNLAAAVALANETTDPSLSARAAVLAADVALVSGELAEARSAAEGVLATEGAAPELRCHAYEIVGRTWRLHDLPAAAAAFEAALTTAERHDLPVWRMRALHELGTVDAFERADVDRLVQARRLAEPMGALSTVAVLDLQLSATFTARWDLEACDRHASSALETARHLGLKQVAAKALAMLAGSASMRADAAATERWAEKALAADPSDPMLAGFCRASVGMALFMAGDTASALGPFQEGTSALSLLPHSEPITIRALWPLILATEGDRRAAAAIDEVCRLGVDAFHLNRGMINFARAVLEGRHGQAGRADALAAAAASSFVNCETWGDLARFVAAPRAIADGWGEPARWLEAARARFAELGLDRPAERCAVLLRHASSNPWAAEGVTDREADVLRLVIEGLPNKEIAAALGLSRRTVEKHVEHLLRKAGARSRTELAGNARRAGP